MAEENKSGAFASSGAVVAAFAAMGVYYFHREAPLVDLRPLTDASIQELVTSNRGGPPMARPARCRRTIGLWA